MPEFRNNSDKYLPATGGMIRPGEQQEVEQALLDWYIKKGWVKPEDIVRGQTEVEHEAPDLF